ncbi:MAG: DUF1559 domain-containing protein [Planctomycetota bacterium]
MSRTQSRGLTRVEVCVLIACVGILLGLLVPAVNINGRPSQSAFCQNNLKQLALAAIQYQNSKGQFPGYAMEFGTYLAGESPTDPTDPEAIGSSLKSHRKIGPWAIALLPILDAMPTYEVWTRDKFPVVTGGSRESPLSTGFAGNGFTVAAAPNLSLFQCPSSPNLVGDHGRNSYIANNGLHSPSSLGRSPSSYSRQGESITLDFARTMAVANGVFNNKFAGLGRDGQPVSLGPNVTLNDFIDGQGHTALFSESLQAMPWHRAGFIDADDLVIQSEQDMVRYPWSSRYTTGMVWHREDPERSEDASIVAAVHWINGVDNDESLLDLEMTPKNAHDLARPSSAHSEGVNMAFADGSVRFIDQTIDYRVYQAMLTPRGKQSDMPYRGEVQFNERSVLPSAAVR